jgi:hypothetical protein
MNDSLKIITKGVNNHLAIVTDDIIYKTQTAFMKNRFIMEGVVVLHEVMKKKLVCISKWTLKKHMTMLIGLYCIMLWLRKFFTQG